MYDLKKAKTVSKARWFEVVTKSCGEFDVLVEPLSCREFKRLFNTLTKPHLKSRREGEIPDSILEPIMKRCIAETIVKDWGRIVSDDEPVPFSIEGVKELLEEDEAYRGIQDAAIQLSKVYAAEQDESEKN